MAAANSPSRPRAVVILAAGKGTRMRSDRAKVLHPIAGAPMLHHALRAALSLAPERLAVVVGDDGAAVAEAARALVPEAAICTQDEQLGTGHAVTMAAPALEGFEGDLYVLFGDTPFLTADTLARMAEARRAADLVALGFDAADPGTYGRMITGSDGGLERIVEAKDASPEELAIPTCNSGIMAADCATFLRLLTQVGNDNAKGEFYLTDVAGLARAEGHSAALVRCNEAETLGINDRAQLAAAEAAFQTQARRAALMAGATMTAPETVYLAWDTRIGRDVTIEPNVVFGLGVEVADGATIRAFCHITESRIGPGAEVGPFARLRPGTVLSDGAKIGNFVEAKNTSLGPGAKANHLTYLGDTTVGAKANIGAGTITCNYDGFGKYRTKIGDGAFIGSNSALIAPVAVGEGAYVGTGTVVTHDVPDDALALARTRQENHDNLASALRQRMEARAAKAKDGKT